MTDITKLSTLIRHARKNQGHTQQELADLIGMSRWWVTQLERGESYNDGEKPLDVDPYVCLKLAEVLNLDPVDVLNAAGVPRNKWPDFSNIVSKSGNVRSIDITTLTPAQADLIAGLVEEMKRGNNATGSP